MEHTKNKENPNYYSIIPANVRYDSRLTPNAKLLYAEITSLCNMNGKCFSTNEYFARLYCVSKVSISKWINQLAEYGYIKSKIEVAPNKQILNRYLSLVNDPIKEKFNTPIKEKFKDNNTSKLDSNNNLTDSNYIYEEKESKEKEEPDYDALLFDEFWRLYTPVKSADGKFVAKGNKVACLAKFKKVLKEGTEYETIIRNLERYLKYCRKNGYCSCGVERYFNDRRYEQDYGESECVNSQATGKREPVSITEIANEFIESSKNRNGDGVYGMGGDIYSDEIPF